MGIKLTTSISEIDAEILKEAQRAEMLIIRALSYLGEQCVNEARDRSPEASWFDQTGNLRSSIGYVIVADGHIVQTSAFNQVKQGSEGPQTGKNLAFELARKYTSGYALIVVAGMNYAALVEAMDNKCVLASAELYAIQKLPEILMKLNSQIAHL